MSARPLPFVDDARRLARIRHRTWCGGAGGRPVGYQGEGKIMSKTILAGSTKSWTKLAACGAALVLAAACASDGAGGAGYGDEARAGHHHHGGGPRHRMQPESFTAFAVNLGTAAPGPAPGQSSV